MSMNRREGRAMSEKPNVVYHLLRQAVFEQSLLFMEAALGRKGKVIDLGAGHCAFTRMAHAMGWHPTALDVRRDRVPSLPEGVDFILGDVTSESWDPKDYDLILCLGLYYHLDQDMQHSLLERCRGKPIIIDTHFANPPEIPTRYKAALGKTYEKNGEMGADYREDGHLDDGARKTKGLLASFENPTSWWQTKDSLLKTLHDYGWPHVWTFDYQHMDHIQRTFFICNTVDYAGNGVSGIRI